MENRAESPTVEDLQHQIAEISAKLKWYEEQFRLAQQKRFGASSEKTNPDQIDAKMQERSLPLLSAYHARLKEQKSKTLPKSLSGQAIAYCFNQWDKLTAFLADGRLELDNNRSERSIKPFVIGRKNWLFANTPRGAKASAAIYSVIELAKNYRLVELRSRRQVGAI